MSILRVTKLNAVPAGYQAIMALQEAIFQQRKDGTIEDTMLLLQHTPVYTKGKRGSDADFPDGMNKAIASGAEIATSPRGGETTYHGPGQLILYPVVNLKELRLGPRKYVETLEDIMIDTAANFGVKARGRICGKTGVWVEDRKLGAIGVAVSGGYTRHGLALNVSTDLSAFSNIIPCGDAERQATSLEKESKGTGPDLNDAANVLAESAAKRLGFGGISWLPDVNILLKEKTLMKKL